MRIYLTILALTSCAAVAENPQPLEPAYFDYRVVNTYPHDPAAFTQGLFFHNGRLFESTGNYGQSNLREVSLKTGDVVQSTALPLQYFGEGSTDWGDKIISLTWRAGVGFVFDRKTLKLEKTFTYDGEGWGLTHDDERLIVSDGTASLRFFEPYSFEEIGHVNVTFRGMPLLHINELEWIDGKVFANVWQTNVIVAIDPETGAVTDIADMRNLLSADEIAASSADVLNGIAFDKQTGRLFVTGKNWPKLFEIELVERRKTDD